MGTTYHVKYHPTPSLTASPDSLKAKIDSVLVEVNRQMSIYLQDSEITAFNSHQSIDPVQVSREFAFVVERALHWSRLSKGAFDITVFPLLFLWGFGPGQGADALSSFPTPSDIEQQLSHVGYQKLNLQDDRLIKTDPYVRIDLNAIAKGFGVDAVFDYLQSLAIAHMMVEIGGEVRVRGKNQRDHPWIIAIERPDLSSNAGKDFEWVCELEAGAAATSGDYRNSFEIDGEIFSHVIDPRTGYPAQTQVASATVTAPNCTDADALATALMVMGEKEGLQLVELIDSVEAFLIIREGKEQFRWVKSSGMKIRQL
ncbi:MAG: FAD:protein FMN transferase [Candidatus Marinimicrobia bacterium]|nr:FAD:protein FMN transferase [Candidatus Neomarinimicrobiota bacterium]